MQVVKALDEIGAPYMIVGAFGGYAFGITRVTFDIDILVDLHEKHFEVLAQK
jgi:predicted nucleotidyltransferase